jgi:hypothetical protein
MKPICRIMKKESTGTFMMCLFLVLLSMCSFFVGFSVNEVIHSKSENEVVAGVQYRIIPEAPDDRPDVGSVIHERVEI